MRVLTLPKALRLSGKIDIENLFQKGKSFTVFPFKVLYRLPTSESEITSAESRQFKVLFTVSSRRFRKATVRNRLRRLMREAFRQEQSLVAGLPPIHIGYIYIGPEKSALSDIRNRMVQSLRKLSQVHVKN